MAKTKPVRAPFKNPITPSKEFSKPVAYFSMEFAIDQSLKTYSGGLGFLAGSHMRSVYDLQQNVIGIGILWKYGYYDQGRKADNSMSVDFREKMYFFLEDTQIRFQINFAGRPTWVQAFYLAPEIFQTAPIFFLTTDVDGNDPSQRSISHYLYDADATQKISQCILLGIGGARLLEEINIKPEVYHFNEAHALPAAFHLLGKLGKVAEVRKKVVFTTHTPEDAGNEKHDIYLLNRLGFFGQLQIDKVMKATGGGDIFNHTLSALRLSRKANAVSKLHGEVARKMWSDYDGVPEIISITNAQNKKYWADPALETARAKGDSEAINARKKELKHRLFSTVANQTGKIFRTDVLTIVWARRFAGYKRPDILTWDMPRFEKLLNNNAYPIQIIWAGKPYPFDFGAINTFNKLYYLSHYFPNMAVLTGHELGLSKLLKDGADVWLNTPVVTREASGTSGMTAAMNASLNLSTNDGWIYEFARDGENTFLLPTAPGADVNKQDLESLYDKLEKVVLPMFYTDKNQWNKMVLTSMNEAGEYFNSDRMTKEYYQLLYGDRKKTD